MARNRKKKRSNQTVLIVIIVLCVVVGGTFLATVTVLALRSRGGAPMAGFGSTLPYSQRVNERMLPADQAPLGAPLWGHKNHPWVKLLTAQQEVSPGHREFMNSWLPGKVVTIDYESSADFETHPAMNHADVHVILKNERGEEMEFGSLIDRRKFESKGTLLVSGVSLSPLSRVEFTPNMEVFVVLEDKTKGVNSTRFKISNSLCIGAKAGITQARSWRPEEVAEIEKMATSPEPVLITRRDPATGQQVPITQTISPASSDPKNTIRDFGGTAPAAANKSASYGAAGGRPFEFAKDAKPVLGFAYRMGQWDRHPSIAMIRPFFETGEPAGFPLSVRAKDGYAVGGIHLETSPYVSGIRVVFMKLDGNRLNPGDQYLSEWIRAENVQGEAQGPILSDGKLVIGIHGNAGAVTNTLGLIFQ